MMTVLRFSDNLNIVEEDKKTVILNTTPIKKPKKNWTSDK